MKSISCWVSFSGAVMGYDYKNLVHVTLLIITPFTIYLLSVVQGKSIIF